MILTIDIGNSNIVVGCMEGTKTVMEERISTDVKKTFVEYAVILKTLLDLHHINSQDIQGGILSSSVPAITEIMQQASEVVLEKSVLVVDPKMGADLNNKLDDPNSLGADLLVGAVAGLAEYSDPLIIIDIGTCTTISVINNKKEFLGGMIIPGIRVSLDGMSLKAAHLPQIAISCPSKLIGSNTIESMQSGVLYGHASCIDGMIDRIWEELGYETTVVATGGLAGKVISCCKHDIIIDDQLLLKGLLLLYDKNK